MFKDICERCGEEFEPEQEDYMEYDDLLCKECRVIIENYRGMSGERLL
jgi:DNA-directed RNA polymerase subunit RPC12/RpoP